MRKKSNNIDASFVLSGLNYGEHRMDPKTLIKDIFEMCQGCANTFTVRLGQKDYPDEMFEEIARFALDNKWYFGFLYAYQFPPAGKESHLNAQRIAKVKAIAGRYFLGEFLGEAGSDKGAKAKGYFKKEPDCLATRMPPQDFSDIDAAKLNYLNFIQKMVDYNNKIGLDQTFLVEATAFSKYNLEGGIKIPILEVMPGSPETLIPFTRGAAVGYNREMWGGFIANEWYGGYRHEDVLKPKRLDLAYKYLYLSGANLVYLESGNQEIRSFGYYYDKESKECTAYRKSLSDFYALIQNDSRPNCGPITKVAFLHGNNDGFTGFMGSSIWSQFDKEEWGMDSPEHSWKILDSVLRSRSWHDFANFGGVEYDLSHAPCYGTFDVLPAECSAEVLSAYDLLIFAGWNTMTEQIYENLKKYVAGGGHLIISAAHFNTSAKRGKTPKFLRDGKLAEFIGCDIKGSFRTNNGLKFTREGLSRGVYYPGTQNFICDCNYPGSYATYAEVEMKGGSVAGFFEDKFAPAPDDFLNVKPFLVENKYGSGVVSFMTNIDYPGHAGVYPKYEVVVKENLTATHRNCDLKVIASDKVRFALYFEEGSDREKLYLLNTDFNLRQNVIVKYRGERKEAVLEPIELISIDY